MSDPVVELSDVRRRFADSGGRTAFELSAPALRVRPGESHLIAGPSGAGKTTLLELLAGLDRPDGGVVKLFGRDVARLSEPALAELRRRRLGFAYQSPAFVEHLPVWKNVSLRLVPDGVPARERRRRAEALLALLGVPGVADRPPGVLSGGERQRVAIARALVGEPELLLADEPTANVDAATRDLILAAFRQLRSRGGTLVLVSHDPALAEFAEHRHEMTAGTLRGA